MISTKTTSQLQQAYNFLSSAKKILITTHESPDGDGIGSMLALNNAFRETNQDISLFCSDAPPSELNFLPYWHEIQTDYARQRYDAIIALDYGDFKRTNVTLEPDNIHTPLVTIDHHAVGNHRGNIQIINLECSSTAEIMYYFFQKNLIKIDKNIATCLLTGIFTDTGGFKHSNTSKNTLKIAGELVSRGGDLDKINASHQSKKSAKHFNLLGEIVKKVHFNSENGMAVAVITQDDIQKYGISSSGMVEIADILCTIPETRFSLLLKEKDDGYFCGSLRSEEFKGIDVAQIAQIFGGGGHKLAAGFRTSLGVEKIIEKIKNYIH